MAERLLHPCLDTVSLSHSSLPMGVLKCQQLASLVCSGSLPLSPFSCRTGLWPSLCLSPLPACVPWTRRQGWPFLFSAPRQRLFLLLDAREWVRAQRSGELCCILNGTCILLRWTGGKDLQKTKSGDGCWIGSDFWNNSVNVNVLNNSVNVNIFRSSWGKMRLQICSSRPPFISSGRNFVSQPPSPTVSVQRSYDSSAFVFGKTTCISANHCIRGATNNPWPPEQLQGFPVLQRACGSFRNCLWRGVVVRNPCPAFDI